MEENVCTHLTAVVPLGTLDRANMTFADLLPSYAPILQPRTLIVFRVLEDEHPGVSTTRPAPAAGGIQEGMRVGLKNQRVYFSLEVPCRGDFFVFENPAY